MILELTGLFLLGAVYDAGFVLWVHFADRHLAVAGGVMACLLYWTSSYNTWLMVHDWRTSIAFGLGMGFGSFMAIRWKARRHSTPKEPDHGEPQLHDN